MISSNYRGYKIVYRNNKWYYEDNFKLVSGDKNRVCGFCQVKSTEKGHDGCLGKLANVMNACCGHGDIDDAYVQLNNEVCIRGKDAIYYMLQFKRGEE